MFNKYIHPVQNQTVWGKENIKKKKWEKKEKWKKKKKSEKANKHRPHPYMHSQLKSEKWKLENGKMGK